MQHPSSEAVYKVADVFKTIHKMSLKKEHNFSLDMSRGIVDEKDGIVCGCHAGWYMYGTEKGIWRDCIYGQVLSTGRDVGATPYTEGADLMAKSLGFKDQFELRLWADNNPYLWGNSYGVYLFTRMKAFGLSKKTLTFKDIFKHWRLVGHRLEGIENDGET